MLKAIKKHKRYITKVLKHKYRVWLAGRLLGVPIWRLIKHDWSKLLSLKEYMLNVEVWGYATRSEQPPEAYNRLRLYGFPMHKKRHDHHPEYWGNFPMAWHALLEMVADWWATNQEHGGNLWAWFYREGQYKIHQADWPLVWDQIEKLYSMKRKGLLKWETR